MGNIFRGAKGIIGILLIIIAIAGVYGWENFGREKFLYDDVLVLRENTEEGTIVTADMLGLMRVEKTSILEEGITDASTIIGKATTTYLPGMTQLVDEFFQDASLTLKEGEYILSIPSSWIVAHPQTLRRLDTIYFYPIEDSEKETITFDANGNPVFKDTTAARGPVCSAKVAYAKDGSNQEIYSVDSSRLAGTGNVSYLEIITTMETTAKLAECVENDMQFVLLYN